VADNSGVAAYAAPAAMSAAAIPIPTARFERI
jgi:hypothetical protein